MSKRWAARERGVRWLAAIGAFVVILAIVWALFAPTADWLAHHDVGSVMGSLHETAVDNARGRLLTLIAGLFAAGALVFTARNFTLSRRTFELTEQGQVTERYTKAIEQLGSDKLDVRIGGIYALERVARDSARDHPTVIEVLTAFIREHSREQWPTPVEGREPERSIRPDVQAAVTVVARRDEKRDTDPIDLSGADLARADISATDLSGANLLGADLRGADLTLTDLIGARLAGVDLIGARLSGAKLSGADLAGAILADANLSDTDPDYPFRVRVDLDDADLRGADLTGARLTNAYLGHADLTDARLTGADLTGGDLFATNLTGADLHDATFTGASLYGTELTGADLTRAIFTNADLRHAIWPQDSAIPEGWKRDSGSGRLERAGNDSGGEVP
jgi:uncharacterized protein YjbI with pentapeptide repeats